MRGFAWSQSYGQAGLRKLTHALFGMLLLLLLGTHSQHWRAGPFTWATLKLPIFSDHLPFEPGLLAMLPLLIFGTWLALRVGESPRRAWQWGRAHITLPLLGLSVLVLISLDWVPAERTVTQLSLLGLVWFLYLFIINERPALVIPIALVLLAQAGVALAQFFKQGDLGLVVLGEMALDPSVPGVTVLYARQQRWLRAYGLTGHPNILSGLLTLLILLLLPATTHARRERRIALHGITLIGVAGLLVTFSRAAWLACAAGLLAWLVLSWVPRRGSGSANSVRWPLVLGIILLSVAFGWVYHDLIGSRVVGLDTSVEARSLYERQRSITQALELIGSHKWRGVGAGNYVQAASSRHPQAQQVHNVPLLVTAELGFPGLLLWLWLVLAPFLGGTPGSVAPGSRRAIVPPWLAFLVIGLFDFDLWPLATLRGAVLFGILIASLNAPIFPTGHVRPSARMGDHAV